MSSGGFDSPASGLCAIFLRFVVGSGSVLTRGGRRIVNTCELKLEIMSIGEKAAGGALSYNTLVPGFIFPPPIYQFNVCFTSLHSLWSTFAGLMVDSLWYDTKEKQAVFLLNITAQYRTFQQTRRWLKVRLVRYTVRTVCCVQVEMWVMVSFLLWGMWIFMSVE